MKTLERIKLFFNGKIEEVMKVPETDQIKEIIKNKKSKLEELSNAYYESEGKRKTLESKVEGCNKTIEDIKVAAKKCKNNNDDVNLNKLFVAKKNVEKELEMTVETLKLTKKMSEDLYTRKTQMETYISSLNHKLEQLKLKEEYTEQANKFLEVMKDTGSDDSFQDSEDIVNINFNASELKIEDFDNDVSVEDILNKYNKDEEFEKFKNEI